MKTICNRIIKSWPDGIKEYCNGETVTIETGNTEIKTTYCKKCGLIENLFLPHALEELNKKAVRVGDDGKIEGGE